MSAYFSGIAANYHMRSIADSAVGPVVPFLNSHRRLHAYIYMHWAIAFNRALDRKDISSPK